MSRPEGGNAAQARQRDIAQSDASRQLWHAWQLSFTLATTLLALGDGLSNARALGPSGLVATLGAALLLGTLAGVVFGALVVCIQKVKPSVAFLLWLVAMAGPAALLCAKLNAFVNLGGRYTYMATGVLAGSGVATFGFASLMLLFHPRARRWLRGRLNPRRLRWSILTVLGLALVGSAVLDRTLYPDGYSAAHTALRLAALWLGSALIFELLEDSNFRINKFFRITTVLAFTLGAIPFVLLSSASSARAAAIAGRPFTSITIEALRVATDFDGDGYSGLLGGGDCAPFDPSVNPEAREIPGNAIDDNCLNGDAATQEALLAEETPLVTTPLDLDVILITMDTVRPDHLSVYGYERDTTPNLKRWAESARRFDEAYTSGGWTSLAVPSLMRGTYPRRLHWNRMVETSRYRSLRLSDIAQLRKGEKARSNYLLPIDDPRMPLAAHLQRRGMQTLAVVDGGFTEILSPTWGLGSGFDQYREIRKEPSKKRNDATTARRAIQLVDKVPADQHYFLWVHFFGPHKPSSQHKGFTNWGKSTADEYDHELSYVDHQVGRVLDHVKQRRGDKLIIITSDHGEYITRGRSHGTNVAEANIRIPLLIEGPGFEPGVQRGIVSLVDVMPTILTATDTPLPSWLDGTSLQTLTEKRAQERVVFVDTFMRNNDDGFRLDIAVALHGPYKLVQNRTKQTLVLNRRDDMSHPARNVLEQTSVPRLRDALNDYIESTGGSPRVLP